jgi:hypothetical protein
MATMVPYTFLIVASHITGHAEPDGEAGINLFSPPPQDQWSQSGQCIIGPHETGYCPTIRSASAHKYLETLKTAVRLASSI